MPKLLVKDILIIVNATFEPLLLANTHVEQILCFHSHGLCYRVISKRESLSYRIQL